jgi:hypothetical protein
MTQPEPSPAVPTLDVYLLFAHEPYYPAAAREINTTVVAAASLLHPRVRQPDGARIHDRLVHGRRPGEIVPLSTLTHELDGGARWPEVGDWEAAVCLRSGGPRGAPDPGPRILPDGPLERRVVRSEGRRIRCAARLNEAGPPRSHGAPPGLGVPGGTGGEAAAAVSRCRY